MALKVGTEELKQVASDLMNKKNEISNICNTKVKSILDESREAISASGLNFDEFKESFGQVFSRLDSKMEALSNALSKEIIPRYENLDSYINKAFNVDFANEMGSLLSKIKE